MLRRLLLIDSVSKTGRFFADAMTAEGWSVQLISGMHLVDAAAMKRCSVCILNVASSSQLPIIRAFRQMNYWRPILAMTPGADAIAALKAGADDFVTSSVPLEELALRLRALARRGNAPEETLYLQIDQLTLDLWANEISLGGQKLDLQAREFDLLAFLIECGGKPASRDNILKCVWDDDGELNPNTVDVYVARLKRKLAAIAPSPTISSVRGYGYRIAERAAQNSH